MIRHIGGGRTVREEEIVAILDLDGATTTALGKAYLHRVSEKKVVEIVGEGIPRSLMLLAPPRARRSAAPPGGEKTESPPPAPPGKPEGGTTPDSPAPTADPANETEADGTGANKAPAKEPSATDPPVKAKKPRRRREKKTMFDGAPDERVLLNSLSAAALCAREEEWRTCSIL